MKLSSSFFKQQGQTWIIRAPGHSDLPSLSASSLSFLPVPRAISPGEDHPSWLPKQAGHPMISDSFRSDVSVAHTNSNDCVCVRLPVHIYVPNRGSVCMCKNTVHHPVSSRLSNPGLQCIPFSQEPRRSSSVLFRPQLVLCISGWWLTPRLSRLVVHSSDQMFPPSQRGKVDANDSYRCVFLCVCVCVRASYAMMCRAVSSVQQIKAPDSLSLIFLYKIYDCGENWAHTHTHIFQEYQCLVKFVEYKYFNFSFELINLKIFKCSLKTWTSLLHLHVCLKKCVIQSVYGSKGGWVFCF